MRGVPPAKVLRAIRALVLDVDGVLTDGGIFITESGDSFRRFDVKDGMGIANLIRAGVRVAFVSADGSPIPKLRAQKLGVTDVFTNVSDKLQAVRGYLAAQKIPPEEAAYMGDDENDAAAMQYVGLGIAPADAHPTVLSLARWVLRSAGGRGAIREAADTLLAFRS